MINRPLSLAFVGDIMLGRHINDLLPQRRVQNFWCDTLPILRSASGVIANLECPITTHPNRWRRTWKAFHFRADPPALDLLETANVRMVNLANNHMLDYEERGLLDTLAHLDAAGIGHSGAGHDCYDATRPALVELAGVKVGLIGLTDSLPEFSAGHDRPGTNHMQIGDDNVTLNLVNLVVSEVRRRGAEIIIVSCHWGPNLRIWPPRRFRNFARRVIDLGVDVLHGHSAHLFQGIELHGSGLILYDTGNILDDYWIFPGVRTDRSFIFVAEFVNRRFSRLRMIPVLQDRTSVHLADGAEFEAICQQMIRRCRPFGTTVSNSADGLEIAPLVYQLARSATASKSGVSKTNEALVQIMPEKRTDVRS
jgi:poly-gamma-glutamate synthesis protein (capsule biosynthesis protein)